MCGPHAAKVTNKNCQEEEEEEEEDEGEIPRPLLETQADESGAYLNLTLNPDWNVIHIFVNCHSLVGSSSSIYSSSIDTQTVILVSYFRPNGWKREIKGEKRERDKLDLHQIEESLTSNKLKTVAVIL